MRKLQPVYPPFPIFYPSSEIAGGAGGHFYAHPQLLDRIFSNLFFSLGHQPHFHYRNCVIEAACCEDCLPSRFRSMQFFNVLSTFFPLTWHPTALKYPGISRSFSLGMVSPPLHPGYLELGAKVPSYMRLLFCLYSPNPLSLWRPFFPMRSNRIDFSDPVSL